MTTYKEIFGKQVKQVSSDPTDAGAEGQVWYNSTLGSFRSVVAVGAWSSGANMPEANYGAGSCGAQTAFLYFGGAPYPSKTNATREYDGSNWTTTGNFTSSRSYLGGCGTQTAALGAGGFPPNTTASAEYDGSTWTAGNSMSQQRMNTGSTFVGIQTAALLTGGDQFPSTPRSLTACEEYDGTNYSSGGAYPVAIQNTAQGGTQTAGWAAGGTSDTNPGTPNTVQSATNEYNGTAWTAGGALPTATFRAGGAGTQTAGLFFAGTTNGSTNLVTSFKYDGSSWTATPSMATARQSIGAGGVSSPSTAAIGAGGYVSPGTTAATEEFGLTIYSPIAATWASTTSTPSPSAYSSGASGGTPTAGFMAGGFSPPNAVTNATLNFDGSSWTSSGNLGASKARMNLGVSGTQTAGLSVGGFTPGSLTSVEEYDGSNWTGGGALPTATQQSGGAGPQTSYMMLGTDSDRSEGLSYNGSAWGSEGSSSQGFAYGALTGQETAALAFYGATSPAGTSRSTGEEYNGTAWTTVVPSLPNQGSSGSAGGTSTASVFAGNDATARYWDGTTVAATASMAVSTRGNFYAIGNSANGFLAVNGSPANHSVEQYNAEQQALNTKTLTSS